MACVEPVVATGAIGAMRLARCSYAAARPSRSRLFTYVQTMTPGLSGRGQQTCFTQSDVSAARSDHELSWATRVLRRVENSRGEDSSRAADSDDRVRVPPRGEWRVWDSCAAPPRGGGGRRNEKPSRLHRGLSPRIRASTTRSSASATYAGSAPSLDRRGPTASRPRAA